MHRGAWQHTTKLVFPYLVLSLSLSFSVVWHLASTSAVIIDWRIPRMLQTVKLLIVPSITYTTSTNTLWSLWEKQSTFICSSFSIKTLVGR